MIKHAKKVVQKMAAGGKDSDNLFVIGGNTFEPASRSYGVLSDIHVFQLRDAFYKYCSVTGGGLFSAVAGEPRGGWTCFTPFVYSRERFASSPTTCLVCALFLYSSFEEPGR